MKVIVRCANNRVTKSEMEQIIESLFQENKDLRVSEGHLRDELTCAQAQIEKLTAELTASSQGMHTMVKFWEEAVNEKIKAEERAEEYHIALMESDCRVDECEKRIEYLEDELKQTEAIANQVIEERDELKAELVKHESKHYQQEAEEWKIIANKLDEQVQDLNAQLRDVQADYNELSDDYSDVQRINRDYAQEIDRLRKVVVDLQTHRFTMSEIQNMICQYLEGFEPSTGSLNF